MGTKGAITPGSIIHLRRATVETPEWLNKVGERFVVEYYSRQDGLEVVWLRNSEGGLETTDQHNLEEYFDVLYFSPNKNFFGDVPFSP